MAFRSVQLRYPERFCSLEHLMHASHEAGFRSWHPLGPGGHSAPYWSPASWSWLWKTGVRYGLWEESGEMARPNTLWARLVRQGTRLHVISLHVVLVGTEQPHHISVRRNYLMILNLMFCSQLIRSQSKYKWTSFNIHCEHPRKRHCLCLLGVPRQNERRNRCVSRICEWV